MKAMRLNGTQKASRLGFRNDSLAFPISPFKAGIAITLISLWSAASLSAATSTWNGGSSTSANWSDAANWGGTALADGNTLTFSGTAKQTKDSSQHLGAIIQVVLRFDPMAQPALVPHRTELLEFAR